MQVINWHNGFSPARITGKSHDAIWGRGLLTLWASCFGDFSVPVEPVIQRARQSSLALQRRIDARAVSAWNVGIDLELLLDSATMQVVAGCDEWPHTRPELVDSLVRMTKAAKKCAGSPHGSRFSIGSWNFPAAGTGDGVESVTLDGQPAAGGAVPLRDDGWGHDVGVTLGNSKG
jgi:hypothetical protein